MPWFSGPLSIDFPIDSSIVQSYIKKKKLISHLFPLVGVADSNTIHQESKQILKANFKIGSTARLIFGFNVSFSCYSEDLLVMNFIKKNCS